MRRVLHHGRHHDLSLLLACPRPKDVNGLGIAQADLVVTGPTPNPYDRERIASEIGFDPAEFTADNKQLRVEHPDLPASYSESDTLYVMPALPAPAVGPHDRRPRRCRSDPAARGAPRLRGRHRAGLVAAGAARRGHHRGAAGRLDHAVAALGLAGVRAVPALRRAAARRRARFAAAG